MMAPAQASTLPFRDTTMKEQMRGSRDCSAVIAIVDDDLSARRGLERLIRSAGWDAESFASAQEFLGRRGTELPSCLVLDLQLPGLSGLDLQKQLAEVGLIIPIVFLTGHGNIPTSVKAMKAGAVEFLTKPVDASDLLRAIQEAVERDRRTRQQQEAMRMLRNRHGLLTAREQQIMQLVISGMLNKQIAAELKITEFTVKFHRGHIMRKMRADSLADLVRMAEDLGIPSQKQSLQS
jgi:FixJ family two-component response regulator